MVTSVVCQGTATQEHCYKLHIWMVLSVGFFISYIKCLSFLGIIAHLLLELVSILKASIAEAAFLSNHASLKLK